jgi:GAF domain-containing protein
LRRTGRDPCSPTIAARLSTGEPIFIPDIKTDPRWSARTDWVEREWIVSFAGRPLVFRDEVLGVLAVFSRREVKEEALPHPR